MRRDAGKPEFYDELFGLQTAFAVSGGLRRSHLHSYR